MTSVILLVIALTYFVSFYKLFPKAGRQAWEGLIPGYNLFIALKLIKRPWWWLLLLIFPGINILMLLVISYQLAVVFNKRSDAELAQAALIPFYYLPSIAFKEDTKYVGQIDKKSRKKSPAREWGDAIIFAVVAATIIRSYFVEAFTIPTSSMEKTLLRGDFLFVSKMSYGPKVPQTPLTIPLTHHSIPLTSIRSYVDWINLPYLRLPGFGDIERNDVVVFNYPEGDTVSIEHQSKESYNSLVRELAINRYRTDAVNGLQIRTWDEYMDIGRQRAKEKYDITVRPVDKREHYIKRCVGVPGDKLEVRNNVLYINDEMAYIPPKFQYSYVTEFNMNTGIASERALVEFGMKHMKPRGIDIADLIPISTDGKTFVVPLTLEKVEELQREQVTKSIKIYDAGQVPPSGPDLKIYPNHPDFGWTQVNFGPITLPKEGATVELNLKNLPIYDRIISVYEGNTLEVNGDQIIINGEATTSYTFKMDYYWMMGDNRHNSQDSRFWGFVPENHVVGKALFIWLSMDPELGLFDGKIRFDRMFRLIE